MDAAWRHPDPGRARRHSHDRVDNGGRMSATTVPELQCVAPGDVMPSLPGGAWRDAGPAAPQNQTAH